MFASKPLIQSNEVNDEVDIKNFKINTVIKVFKVFEATAVIYINLIIYNIIILPIYINKFKTDSINLLLFKTFIATKASKAPKVNIATVAPEALKADNVTVVNLIINITTKLFIQSNKVLLN